MPYSAYLSRFVSRRSHVVAFGAGLLATAVLAAVALAYAQDSGSPDNEAPPPSGSLLPGQSSLPVDATPIAALAPGEMVTMGRIVILPPGSVPSYDWAVLPTIEQARGVYDITADGIARADGQGITLVEPAPPLGFHLDSASAETFLPSGRDDPIVWRALYRFVADDQFAIEVEVRLMAAGESVEVVQYDPITSQGLATMDIANTLVVLPYGGTVSAIQPVSGARFVLAGYDVAIYADAVPPDLMVAFVASWIETHRALYEAAQP